MTSLYNMSVQEIVDKMDNEKQKYQKKEPSNISKPKTTFLSHKLGRRNSVKFEDELIWSSNFKLKATFILIMMGLFVLLLSYLMRSRS